MSVCTLWMARASSRTIWKLILSLPFESPLLRMEPLVAIAHRVLSAGVTAAILAFSADQVCGKPAFVGCERSALAEVEFWKFQGRLDRALEECDRRRSDVRCICGGNIDGPLLLTVGIFLSLIAFGMGLLVGRLDRRCDRHVGVAPADARALGVEARPCGMNALSPITQREVAG